MSLEALFLRQRPSHQAGPESPIWRLLTIRLELLWTHLPVYAPLAYAHHGAAAVAKVREGALFPQLPSDSCLRGIRGWCKMAPSLSIGSRAALHR